MVDVSEHIAPMDGVSDADIKFAGFDVARRGAASMRFDLFQHDICVGTFRFMVGPTGKGIERMIAEAHTQMTNALRQMLHRNDVLRAVYERSAASASLPDSEVPPP
jgi:hypothetical protein